MKKKIVQDARIFFILISKCHWKICFEGGGALEHVSQKTHSGCVQDQVGWTFEEHGPVEGLPDHRRKVEIR